ncbi:hypothetical protein J6590_098253 [Homalodisca vitripennis]|nr:hypothetical protein J6590_098253 [Homalodisca vitripennis]
MTNPEVERTQQLDVDIHLSPDLQIGKIKRLLQEHWITEALYKSHDPQKNSCEWIPVSPFVLQDSGSTQDSYTVIFAGPGSNTAL